MKLDFSVDGIDGVEAALEDAFAELIPAVEKGMRRGTIKMAGTAKRLSPTPVSGQLINSIRAEKPEVNGTTVIGKVVAGAEHAVYVEMGTGPKGAASDVGKTLGATYHTGEYERKDGTIVKSGGQEAQPYMYPAYVQDIGYVQSAIEKEIKKAVEGG